MYQMLIAPLIWEGIKGSDNPSTDLYWWNCLQGINKESLILILQRRFIDTFTKFYPLFLDKQTHTTKYLHRPISPIESDRLRLHH